jgi:hypothetical protein
MDSFFMQAICEGEGWKVIVNYVLSRFGRRRPLCVYFFIGGTALIIAGALPKSNSKIFDVP